MRMVNANELFRGLVNDRDSSERRADDTVYLGTIKSFRKYGILVAFDVDREGFVHYSKIPGCESRRKLREVCHIGDQIKVRKGDRPSRLDCVEFPVDEEV